MASPITRCSPTSQQRRRRRLCKLALLAALPGVGCGREFFRQWADQDVTEAVFEKSRDARFRLPLFTIDPPAMARYADYSDPDRPPAPPDDPTTEALSPYPQKPAWRLMVPMEGTGYLDQLEQGPRYVPSSEVESEKDTATTDLPPLEGDAPPSEPGRALPDDRNPSSAPGNLNIPAAPAPNRRPAEPNALPGATSPEADMPALPGVRPTSSGSRPPAPRENPGPFAAPVTPNNNVPASASGLAHTGGPVLIPPQSRRSDRDSKVLAAAFQSPGAVSDSPGSIVDVTQDRPEQPIRPGRARPVVPGGELNPDQVAPPRPGQGDIQEPRPLNIDINAPPITRPDMNPQDVERLRAATAGFAAKLSKVPIEANQAQLAGLPAMSQPYVVGPAQSLQLALTNSRPYQFRLENVYIQALAVTLTRFAFEPQFYAGMSPTTGVATGPTGQGGSFPQGGTGVNQFTYRTKEFPGGQASQLSLNEAAGWGKLFSFGGRLLAGFANTTVFNFISPTNPSQPTVQSTLPLSFVQPFLRNGGRAVTLEPLTQAERTLLYEVRSFARFRQQFFVWVLTSSAAQGVTVNLDNPGLADPTVGFLQLLSLYLQAENARVTVASFERALEIFREYAKGGASSGISPLQVDQMDQQYRGNQIGLINAQIQYRNALDQYKYQVGMPPDTPLVPDIGLIQSFRGVLRELIDWQADEKHDPVQLPGIVGKLPRLEKLVLDDRALFEYFKNPEGEEQLRLVFGHPERLEQFLIVAERIGLENRLDLMNQRATLYDTWRQYAVTANALLPLFTVQYNYSLSTPSTTTNPFGFNSQSSLSNFTLNTELPLVRMQERNNFRTAMINYQRGRRALMNLEDQIKFAIRQEVRALLQLGQVYELNKTQLILVLRQRDQSLQQIIAPPDQGAAAGTNPSNAANQATQTINFITAVNNILNFLNQLITTWTAYETARMALYRDLGIMPYDEWEAYYELFPTNAAGNANKPGAGEPAAGRAPNAVGPQAERGS